MSKTKSSFLVLVIIGGFLLLNILTLKEGHNWGGDFSQYIRQAQNILEGKPYNFTYDLEPWANYPLGFPLLLMPLIKLFGLNFALLKLPNIFYWLIFTFFTYLTARRRLGEDLSLLVAMVLLSSPFFFAAKQSIISDFPFIALTAAAIYYFMEFCEQGRTEPRPGGYLWISLVLMVLSVHVRLIGLILLIAALFYCLVTRERKKTILGTIAALIIALGLLFLTRTSSESYLYEFSKISPAQWCARFSDHVAYNIMQFILFFIPVKTRLTIAFFTLLAPLFKLIAFILFGAVFIPFIRKLKDRSVTFIECFFAIYFLSITLWWIEQGGRYIMPIAGLTLIFLIENLTKFSDFLMKQKVLPQRFSSSAIATVILLLLLFHNVISTKIIYDFDDTDITRPVVVAMTTWIKNNTAPDDRVMFMRPRVLGMLTGRPSVTFLRQAQETDLRQRIQKFKIDYLVFTKPRVSRKFSRFNNPGYTFDQLKNPQMIASDSGNITLKDQYGLADLILSDPIWENEEFGIYQVITH